MKRADVRPIFFYALGALVVAAVVVAVSLLGHRTGQLQAKTSEVAPRAGSAGGTHGPGAAVAACPTFLKGRLSNQSLSYVESARDLAHQERFNEALTRYRALSSVDPSYPGLNLEISMTLSRMKQTEAAKQAIDAQVAVGQCTAALQADELSAYCKAEGYSSTASCTEELSSIDQAAHYQAALVQMALAHGTSRAPFAAGEDAWERQVAGTKSTSALMAKMKPENTGKAKPTKTPAGNPLASGSGTDAALGAYAK